jgi:hypothetical protein
MEQMYPTVIKRSLQRLLAFGQIGLAIWLLVKEAKDI